MIRVTNMTLSHFELIKDRLLTDFDDFWKPEILNTELLNENSKCIIAENSLGEILGFASIWKAVDDIHITNIAVRKDARTQGIGSLLLKGILEISKNYGFQSVTLEVKDTNIPAIELYLKHGFKKVGMRKKYYNNTDDAVIMTKEIYE